jgi:hypothetical protein
LYFELIIIILSVNEFFAKIIINKVKLCSIAFAFEMIPRIDPVNSKESTPTKEAQDKAVSTESSGIKFSVGFDHGSRHRDRFEFVFVIDDDTGT